MESEEREINACKDGVKAYADGEYCLNGEEKYGCALCGGSEPCMHDNSVYEFDKECGDFVLPPHEKAQPGPIYWERVGERRKRRREDTTEEQQHCSGGGGGMGGEEVLKSPNNNSDL